MAQFAYQTISAVGYARFGKKVAADEPVVAARGLELYSGIWQVSERNNSADDVDDQNVVIEQLAFINVLLRWEAASATRKLNRPRAALEICGWGSKIRGSGGRKSPSGVQGQSPGRGSGDEVP